MSMFTGMIRECWRRMKRMNGEFEESGDRLRTGKPGNNAVIRTAGTTAPAFAAKDDGHDSAK